MNEITRDSPIPAYYQIALHLRERIQRLEWPSGGKLPPEPDLAREYGVSRVTLRQALAELEKDGFLARQQGRGTFVKAVPQPLVHDLSLPLQMAGQLRQLGYSTASEVLEATTFDRPRAEVSEHLRIPADQPVAFLKRLLLVNERPVAINRSWFSEQLCPGIALQDLVGSSLSTTLAQRYGLIPARAENWLEAVRATERDASLLGTTIDTPLVVLTTVSYLRDGTPLEYSITSWLGDNVRFHFNMDFQARSDDSPLNLALKP